MNQYIKAAICGLTAALAIALITSCKMSRKHRFKRAAFKTMRGFNGIVCGIKELL